VSTTLNIDRDVDLDDAWRERHLAEQEILRQALEESRRKVVDLQRHVERLELTLANVAAIRTTAVGASSAVPRRWSVR
jgi:hypothetical protein